LKPLPLPIGHKLPENGAKSAGITGNYTNHSLKATAVTCLAGVDEQLIIQRTGHLSTAVQSTGSHLLQIFTIMLSLQTGASSIATSDYSCFSACLSYVAFYFHIYPFSCTI